MHKIQCLEIVPAMTGGCGGSWMQGFSTPSCWLVAGLGTFTTRLQGSNIIAFILMQSLLHFFLIPHYTPTIIYWFVVSVDHQNQGRCLLSPPFSRARALCQDTTFNLKDTKLHLCNSLFYLKLAGGFSSRTDRSGGYLSAFVFVLVSLLIPVKL